MRSIENPAFIWRPWCSTGRALVTRARLRDRNGQLGCHSTALLSAFAQDTVSPATRYTWAMDKKPFSPVGWFVGDRPQQGRCGARPKNRRRFGRNFLSSVPVGRVLPPSHGATGAQSGDGAGASGGSRLRFRPGETSSAPPTARGPAHPFITLCACHHHLPPIKYATAVSSQSKEMGHVITINDGYVHITF